jgi:hypothetical protein
MGPSNLAATAAFFADAAAHDYHLADGAAAIDTGERLDPVTTDRDGTARPQGTAWDIGAYEHCSGASCAGPPDAGPVPDAGAGVDGGGTPGTDAGGTPRDAGARADGSTSPPASDEGGCGCIVPADARGVGRGAGGAAALLLVFLTLVSTRRRRAR